MRGMKRHSVCVECRHSSKCGMKTFGKRGMQTFEYAWNADIQVCGRRLQVLEGVNCVRGKVSSAVSLTKDGDGLGL